MHAAAWRQAHRDPRWAFAGRAIAARLHWALLQRRELAVTPDALDVGGNVSVAFVDTLKDPELLSEAKKSKLDIEVIDGPTIAKKLGQLYELQPAVIAKLKEVLLPKK